MKLLSSKAYLYKPGLKGIAYKNETGCYKEKNICAKYLFVLCLSILVQTLSLISHFQDFTVALDGKQPHPEHVHVPSSF